jgi:nicotinate phosphoribosyltransferase
MLMSHPLSSVALQTDLYQLTMAQGYWKLGKHLQLAVFDLFFRENPFQGAYSICCGLEAVVHFIENYHFTPTDIQYLESLVAPDNTPLFQPDFLKALSQLRLTLSIEAMEEGALVFPKEPLLRVQGPLWQCQLVETAILNIINFSTLIATKAARVCWAAGSDPVIEFGIRRAQGPNGALTASRSAFVGGVSSTSNILAGQQFGIPVNGTHAHSWVMAFDSEVEAFKNYAAVFPNNCVFLVDTYKTIEGVKRAIEVGKQLKIEGIPFLGVRLDSGDLGKLSIEARALLDKAGFYDTKIIASNNLDEYVIESIKASGARIDIWGVGTRLVTGYDQPALGAVYKLVAIKDDKKGWQYKAKQTDDPQKETNIGIYGVRRVSNNNYFVKDILYNILSPPTMFESYEECLTPIFQKGKRIYDLPSLTEIQGRTGAQLQKLPKNLKQLISNVQYTIEFSKGK